MLGILVASPPLPPSWDEDKLTVASMLTLKILVRAGWEMSMAMLPKLVTVMPANSMEHIHMSKLATQIMMYQYDNMQYWLSWLFYHNSAGLEAVFLELRPFSQGPCQHVAGAIQMEELNLLIRAPVDPNPPPMPDTTRSHLVESRPWELSNDWHRH